MTSVFVVTVEEWEDTVTMGVFSTREKAEKFVTTLDDSDREFAEVTEWVVN